MSSQEVAPEVLQEVNGVSDADTTGEAGNDTTATEAQAGLDVQLVTDRGQIKQALEAIIFAAPKAISTLRLKNLLAAHGYDTTDLKEILSEMISETEARGVQLVSVAGGFQYRTHPEHAPILQKLLEDKPARLSASALEVLAIVAYKQPVTRAEIDQVRGVDSGHLMAGLLEKNLVRTEGHAETPGRPLLYGTAPYFLEVFGLSSLDDLPQLDEVGRELQEKVAELTGSETFGESDLGAFMPDSSGLSADPDRGAFDQETKIDEPAADFGLEERAREALEQQS